MKFLEMCKECFSASTRSFERTITLPSRSFSNEKCFIHSGAEGKKLGLVGWVQNTDRGTVQGQLQGPTSKVRHMQEWLETRGSPKSHIDRANFNNEKVIVKLDYSNFQIVK
ncbi:acylphosphatase-1 isoform X1 [Choloepus didactylus]|uniref:acylphosphatase-1 isoform X1 n=1 Tax=Choloepus didactylus TaxID=27675 RepID=UPI00189CEF4F|nr:acylphosphatase-1 isoform X1 [Choloepus didactylus]